MSEKVIIEVAKSYIRIVEGKFHANTIEVNKCIEKFFDENLIREDIKIDEILLQLELRNIFKEYKTSKKNINVILSGVSNILIRELELPEIDGDKIYNTIRFEARQYFPINLDNYVLDYKQLKVINEGNLKKKKILVVGVHKMLIEGIINAFQNAGLRISKIDIEPNSIVKLFNLERKINNLGESLSYMIVNITRNGVSTSVVVQNDLAATKLFSIAQLEEMFKENNNGIEYEFSLLEDLISESVIKFYDFIRTREEPVKDLKKIYLTGEVCQYIDISNLLRRRLDVDIELAKEFKSIKKECIKDKNMIFSYITAFSGLI